MGLLESSGSSATHGFITKRTEQLQPQHSGGIKRICFFVLFVVLSLISSSFSEILLDIFEVASMCCL